MNNSIQNLSRRKKSLLIFSFDYCVSLISLFISINLKDNTSPIIALEDSNNKLIYVLMPMRVSQ